MIFLSSWFKESRHHLLEPLPSNPRFSELAGAMRIAGVRRGDLGSYRCVSRNAAGETSTTLHLIRPKTSSSSTGGSAKGGGLEVRLDPELKVANLGSSAKFTCRIVDKTKSATGDEMQSRSGKITDPFIGCNLSNVKTCPLPCSFQVSPLVAEGRPAGPQVAPHSRDRVLAGDDVFRR